MVDSSYSKEPADLERLRTSWERARERALKPIDLIYCKELERLKLKYTRLGKLEDALAVQNELQKIKPPSEPKVTSKKQATMELLTSSECRWNDGTILKFRTDGTIGSKYKWLNAVAGREDGTFLVYMERGTHWVFRLDDQGKTARAVNEKGKRVIRDKTSKVITITPKGMAK
jgi:hypothetical protein